MIETAVRWVAAATALCASCAALADEGGWPKLIEPPEAEIVIFGYSQWKRESTEVTEREVDLDGDIIAAGAT